MAGEQAYLPTCLKKKTYGRVYKAFGTNDLRISLLEAGAEKKKEIGDGYGLSPENFAGKPLWSKQTVLPGGGFFKTIKKLDISEDDCDYILSKFTIQLEKISGLSIPVILKQYAAYGIDSLIYDYFESVVEAKDGDLAVYRDSSGIHRHTGVYKNSQPNWNSPRGGTIESRWGSYIFQHDVFFLPMYQGETVEFYRVKNPDILSLPNEQVSPKVVSVQKANETGRHYCVESEEIHLVRRKISESASPEGEFPEISVLNHIKFRDLCWGYAFGKILGMYSFPLCVDRDEILERHFTVTKQPQKGDLVVYYNEKNSAVHYGIFCSQELVESKWGRQSVYQHPPFYVPKLYGKYIVYYRLTS